MILMAYARSPGLSVFLLSAYLGILAASFPGVQSNFVDLAPNFSGPVFSISNFLAACLGLTGPIVVGLIVTEAVILCDAKMDDLAVLRAIMATNWKRPSSTFSPPKIQL